MPEPQSLVRIPGRGVAAQEKLQLLCEREHGQPSAPDVRTAQQKHTARHTPRHNAGTKVGVGYSRSKLVARADAQARCGAPKGTPHEVGVLWQTVCGITRTVCFVYPQPQGPQPLMLDFPISINSAIV